MIDIQLLKSQITEDGIISLMDSLGIPVVNSTQQYLIFPSACHHKETFMSHKPKLYYYVNSQQFLCYSCNGRWDIISLIQHLKRCNFSESIDYICAVLGLKADKLEQDNSIDRWQEMRRWLSDGDIDSVKLPNYNQSVLSLFNPYYPKDWLEYGITKETMDKFHIGWYDRLACISIPVFFNGDLVGIRGRFTKQRDCENGKYRPIATLDGTIYKFSTNQLFYGYDQNKEAISKSKTAILFESEKSVLKAPSYGIDNSLAVFGSNISKRHIELLLELGVNNVMLMFDSDYHIVGNNDEFNFFVAKIKRIVAKLSPYFDVSVIYNNQGYDGYKFSPVDFSYEQFWTLYNNRVKIK